MNKMAFIFVLLLCPFIAKHALQAGPYVGICGGYTAHSAYQFSDLKAKSQEGYYGGMSLGYRLFNWLAVEGEVTYRTLTLNSIKSRSDFDTRSYKGHAHAWSYMVNGLYFPFSCFLQPYLGVGVGYVHPKAEWKWTEISDSLLSDVKQSTKSDSFAWQLIGGVSFPIPCSDVEIGIEYRYLRYHMTSQNHNVGVCIKRFF
jgi:opacity protein-like surface antigen